MERRRWFASSACSTQTRGNPVPRCLGCHTTARWGQTLYPRSSYLHSSAITGNYAHEMDEAGHRRLLECVRECEGTVMLSGYPNDLYQDVLHDPGTGMTSPSTTRLPVGRRNES